MDVSSDFQQLQIRQENAKSRKSRFVDLNTLAQAVLRDIETLKVNEYVFPGNLPGSHLTNPNKTFEAVKKKAGLGYLRIHDLRHSFVSLSLA